MVCVLAAIGFCGTDPQADAVGPVSCCGTSAWGAKLLLWQYALLHDACVP